MSIRYQEFQQAVLGAVRAGPGGVASCVQEYDKSLCQYLRVTRDPPRSKVSHTHSNILVHSLSLNRRAKQLAELARGR